MHALLLPVPQRNDAETNERRNATQRDHRSDARRSTARGLWLGAKQAARYLVE